MYKPKSWPHAVIALIVMAVFVFLVPPLPVIIYAALLPVVYYYGREVRDAENALGMTKVKYLAPLAPWMWPSKDNRWDLYLPIVWVIVAAFSLTFWTVELK